MFPTDQQMDGQVWNFTSDWKSGVMLSVLVQSMRPGTMDLASLNKSASPSEEVAIAQCSAAMNAAAQHFGIASWLEPADMAAAVCFCSNVTYIAMFRSYALHHNLSAPPPRSPSVRVTSSQPRSGRTVGPPGARSPSSYFLAAPPSTKQLKQAFSPISSASGRSPFSREQLLSAFAYFDLNGDKVIDKDEFVTTMSQFQSEAASESLFMRLDHNKDGKIEMAEFERGFTLLSEVINEGVDISPLASPVPSPNTAALLQTEREDENASSVCSVDDLRKLFHMFDANGDGHIDREEFVAVLSVFKKSEGELAFTRLDTDHDGHISFAEFKDGIASVMALVDSATPKESTPPPKLPSEHNTPNSPMQSIQPALDSEALQVSFEKVARRQFTKKEMSQIWDNLHSFGVETLTTPVCDEIANLLGVDARVIEEFTSERIQAAVREAVNSCLSNRVRLANKFHLAALTEKNSLLLIRMKRQATSYEEQLKDARKDLELARSENVALIKSLRKAEEETEFEAQSNRKFLTEAKQLEQENKLLKDQVLLLSFKLVYY